MNAHESIRSEKVIGNLPVLKWDVPCIIGLSNNCLNRLPDPTENGVLHVRILSIEKPAPSHNL